MNQLLTCVMLMPVACERRVSEATGEARRRPRSGSESLTFEKTSFWSSVGYGFVMFCETFQHDEPGMIGTGGLLT